MPLAEESEAYEIEVLDGPGGPVVRTLSASNPSVLYTAAQQSADFGGPIAWPGSLSLNIYQLSASFGRGLSDEATLFFPLPVEV